MLTSDEFRDYGRGGEGDWIDVYARRGHVFLVIAGLRFDTGWNGGSHDTGPRWSTRSRPADGCVIRHPAGTVNPGGRKRSAFCNAEPTWFIGGPPFMRPTGVHSRALACPDCDLLFSAPSMHEGRTRGLSALRRQPVREPAQRPPAFGGLRGGVGLVVRGSRTSFPSSR